MLAVLLVLLELLLVGGGLWQKTRVTKVETQAPDVRRIENKQDLIAIKLDQVAQNELRPISILSALNDGRPNGIYFTNTVTEGRTESQSTA